MQPAIEPAANVLCGSAAQRADGAFVNVPAEPEINFDDDPELIECEGGWTTSDPLQDLIDEYNQGLIEDPDLRHEIEEEIRVKALLEQVRQQTEQLQQERHNQILQAIEQWVDEDDEDEYNEINAPTNGGPQKMTHQC